MWWAAGAEVVALAPVVLDVVPVVLVVVVAAAGKSSLRGRFLMELRSSMAISTALISWSRLACSCFALMGWFCFWLGIRGSSSTLTGVNLV